ncbi:hypothetical protein CLAFUW4_04265 [Fulvia fulva]|uniref:Uncharacterized protein n=1 Tax=Passalora fulva TaxID=5499 RepID=A0A9Q8P777_PASFU|nr:uncharacterized protein CLAFUR5_04231 [Fulvia fulva]KAK4626075.1 hypothetical protein CLAFUR4_04251 [Fulvia fulva]KAK4627623.1 hypothetical protein CLAFUR0_04253 [Fulvia fulva]UJO15809.1 hypothetical protein CLAFUR5_04231 [Fulvia fulva]WPV14397.1 hypothetical protein CLAFUW4_04265 [Fulvia fulva]WPV28261.1 hypothetical protein CLAFUW7_04254 [Fulvia fulva]
MEQDDWQTEHFNHRRIGHGHKGKGSAKGAVFDPRRCYGVYQLQCPALAKLQPTAGSAVKSVPTLEIHGPVEGHDDALMCSLEMPGLLSGVAILAGSRKVLSSVVQDLEHPEPEEEEDEEEEEEEEEDEAAGGSENGGKGESSNEEEQIPKSSLELADEKERRRYAAFEKNSFRSPKFWMRWRAVRMISDNSNQDDQAADIEATRDQHPEPLPGHTSHPSVEVDGGYLVFSGNDCASFSGTISCRSFDWKNVKLSGTKVVSKARECPRGWGDIVVEET